MATYEGREVHDADDNGISAADVGGFTALIEAGTINATQNLAGLIMRRHRSEELKYNRSNFGPECKESTYRFNGSKIGVCD